MSKNDLSKLSDAELFRHVRAGTPNALDVFRERKNKSTLMSYFHNVLHNAANEREADMNTWENALIYLYEHPEAEVKSIDGWLRTIAYHCMIDIIHNEEDIYDFDFVPDSPDTVPDELAMLIGEEDHQLLEWGIMQLPPRMRLIVRLVLEEKPYAEIEKIMGLKPKSGSSFHKKAVERLGEIISKKYGK